MSKRLPPVAGEWIDRSQPIEFSFEGKRYSGFAGDTISSTLHAADVRAMGRSFKYHRLRGILSMANHDVNTMMQVGHRLNLRADVTPLENGMNATAINTRGGLRADRLAIMDKLAPFLRSVFTTRHFTRRIRSFQNWNAPYATLRAWAK